MSLRQPFPPVAMPMVDSNGAPTQAWVQFFLALFNRTNGPAGPAAPLTGDESTQIAALTAQVATANANASSAQTAAASAQQVANDAETIGLFSEIQDQIRSDDQAAFLAQVIAD